MLIVQRLEVFDWLKEHPSRKIIKESATGYLIASIRDRYITVPKGFETRADRSKRLAVEQEAQRQDAEARAEREAGRAREAAKQAAIREFWDALSADERETLLVEALAAADPESRASYEQLRDKPLGRAALGLIRDVHIARKLGLG